VTVNLDAAASFLATQARVLDRRRFQLLMDETDVDTVLAAVEAYRNPDGGYGWGLEPDLRAPESQPGGALHALEVFEEIAPALTPRAVELCDWLASVARPDGGLPFALAMADATACAPFWAQADPTRSALQSTAFVLAPALRIAHHDPAVAAHPFLAPAVEFCFDAVTRLVTQPHAIELSWAIQFLDAAYEKYSEAEPLLEALGGFIPDDGVLPVAGGAPDEAMRPLDFAPVPGRPARHLFSPEAVAAHLRLLVDQQQDDGGWAVDFSSYSPAAGLEWRGYVTVKNVQLLLQNGVI
jgi:hypothetical protein